MTELFKAPEPDLVKRFCEGYIRRLRKILKRNPPKDRPCSHCAFNPKTDSEVGFLSTVWSLMQAAMNDRPFFCHRNMPTVDGEYKPDPTKMIPCANYQAIRHCDKEIDQAMKDAAVESEPLRR
jgi:hypothetical protein